ncbi:hypothetical protein [Methanosphaerula palustris]|uniref:hypothetical protein n=1 Tax=Methanosphaerula palustris TaxID=475088 RepID=UPI000324235A|nr:hypothetical protein [Methanosphaerula palustris]
MNRNLVHVYDVAGRYAISLSAIGSNRARTKTIEQYLNAALVTLPATATHPVPPIG